MIISIITPAYNASQTIGETLKSVFAGTLPGDWELEVLVVDDGSADGEELEVAVRRFENVKLYRQEENQGKNAAVNFAVARCRGDVVIILDADDTLLETWPDVLASIMDDWPKEAPLCFSACQTRQGDTTVADPDYTGTFSLADIICEKHMGEYLPLFRGDAIRDRQGYRDAGRGVGCELWTYLTFAKTADLWITSRVMRVYNDRSEGTLSALLFTPQGAARLVACYDAVFGEFEEDYKRHSDRNLGRRRLRQAVFASISGDRARAWSLWKSGMRFSAPLDTLGAGLLILLGGKAIPFFVSFAKKMRLVRRYG